MLTKRKIQSYKDGQFGLNLPALWAEELGLKKGVYAEITKQGNKLIIQRA